MIPPEYKALLDRFSSESVQRTKAKKAFTSDVRSLLIQSYQEHDPEKWGSELRDLVLMYLYQSGSQDVKDLFVTAINAINKRGGDNG